MKSKSHSQRSYFLEYLKPFCSQSFIFTSSIKSVILPVILYGCETTSLILKKEHTVILFKNKVLKRIFWTN